MLSQIISSAAPPDVAILSINFCADDNDRSFAAIWMSTGGSPSIFPLTGDASLSSAGVPDRCALDMASNISACGPIPVDKEWSK